MGRRALLACVLTLAAASVGSAAWGRTVHTRALVGGPVLAGDHVVWAQRVHGPFGHVVVRAQAGSERAQSVATLSRPFSFIPYARLAASRRMIGVEQISNDSDEALPSPPQRDSYAGPPTGPLERLDRRCDVGRWIVPRTIDVSDRSVFYVPCDSPPAVYNANTGDSTALPANARGLRLAGRYAAWVNGDPPSDSVTVYDRSADSVAYVIPRAAAPDGIRDLDLQDDGTVAIAYPLPTKRAIQPEGLAWASVAEPRLHRLAVKRADDYHVKIARRLVAFDRGTDDNGELSRTTLGYIGLGAGAREHVVATEGSDQVFEEHFDFDGRRMAWFSYGCRDVLVHVTSAARRVSARRHGCRLRLRRQAVVRHRRVRLDPNCFGFVLGGCDARHVRITRAGVTVAAGRTEARIRLTRRGRALFRTRRTVRARVAATLVDDAGRHERRAVTTTIRRE